MYHVAPVIVSFFRDNARSRAPLLHCESECLPLALVGLPKAAHAATSSYEMIPYCEATADWKCSLIGSPPMRTKAKTRGYHTAFVLAFGKSPPPLPKNQDAWNQIWRSLFCLLSKLNKNKIDSTALTSLIAKYQVPSPTTVARPTCSPASAHPPSSPLPQPAVPAPPEGPARHHRPRLPFARPRAVPAPCSPARFHRDYQHLLPSF